MKKKYHVTEVIEKTYEFFADDAADAFRDFDYYPPEAKRLVKEKIYQKIQEIEE